MIRLAFRNLFQNRARLIISVGGVALSLLLILSLDAIFTGVEGQVTAYIDHSGADIFVSQAGVRNMHMASSSLPDSVETKVKAVAGVESVTPILYATNMIVVGEERNAAYIIGLPTNVKAGGAWIVSSGRSAPNKKGAIIDRGVAEKSGVGLGDEVEIFGEDFKVVGLSEGTASLFNSVAFIASDDFADIRDSANVVSFLLVKVKEGYSPESVSTQIESLVDDVTAQPRIEFAEQERKVIKDMSTDVIAMMNLIAFFIGLAVMALTVYVATHARRAEYGVLKALGARNTHLYFTVMMQALMSVILGFAVGLIFTLLLTIIAPRLSSSLALAISGESLIKTAAVSLTITVASAVLPIMQIAGLDPAMVFRK